MRYSRFLILVALLVIFITACGAEEPPTPTTAPTAEPIEEQIAQPTEAPIEISVEEQTTSDNPLAGTFWILTHLNEDPALAETVVTAEFMDNGVLTGSSGCNSYTTTYEVDGDNITIDLGSGGTTLMMCPEEVISQEDDYIVMLGEARTYTVNDEVLVLFDDSNVPVAEYEAVSQELAGSSWNVTSYNNGQGGVVSIIGGTAITAIYGEDGLLTGNAGCNDYSGGFEYDAEGRSISIGPLSTTRKACPDEIMDQEAAYLAAIETAATYRIDGMSLNLRNEDRSTVSNMIRMRSDEDLETAPDETAANTLVDNIWNLSTLNGSELVPTTAITAEFFEEGFVAGFSGCNNYTATYEADSENITINISPAATTRKACPGPIAEQESDYLSTLAEAATFEVSEERLTLYDSGGNPVAEYAAVSQELTSTAWQVISYNNGTGGVVSVQLDTQITAAFGEDGQIAGNAGCNEYFGPYEAEDNNIAMGPFGTTRKLCPDPVMDQENQYLAALVSAATYKFDGITLNMRTADGATAVNMQPVSTVSGQVTNVDNASIPEGAILTVQIQDTSLQDVAATVIGEQIIENPGQFPIDYEVAYDPNDIAGPKYTMSARLTTADGTLLFINNTAIQVITNGMTEDVEIPVIAVGG